MGRMWLLGLAGYCLAGYRPDRPAGAPKPQESRYFDQGEAMVEGLRPRCFRPAKPSRPPRFTSLTSDALPAAGGSGDRGGRLLRQGRLNNPGQSSKAGCARDLRWGHADWFFFFCHSGGAGGQLNGRPRGVIDPDHPGAEVFPRLLPYLQSGEIAPLRNVWAGAGLETFVPRCAVARRAWRRKWRGLDDMIGLALQCCQGTMTAAWRDERAMLQVRNAWC